MGFKACKYLPVVSGGCRCLIDHDDIQATQGCLVLAK